MIEAMTKAEIPGRVEFLIGAKHGWGGAERKRTRNNAVDFIVEHTKNNIPK